MYCKNCGTEINDSNAKFCSKCGYPTGEIENDSTNKPAMIAAFILNIIVILSPFIKTHYFETWERTEFSSFGIYKVVTEMLATISGIMSYFGIHIDMNSVASDSEVSSALNTLGNIVLGVAIFDIIMYLIGFGEIIAELVYLLTNKNSKQNEEKFWKAVISSSLAILVANAIIFGVIALINKIIQAIAEEYIPIEIRVMGSTTLYYIFAALSIILYIFARIQYWIWKKDMKSHAIEDTYHNNLNENVENSPEVHKIFNSTENEMKEEKHPSQYERIASVPMNKNLIIVIGCVVAVLCVVILLVSALKSKNPSGNQEDLIDHDSYINENITLSESNHDAKYDTVCPSCNAVILLEDDILQTKRIICPNCGEDLDIITDMEDTGTTNFVATNNSIPIGIGTTAELQTEEQTIPLQTKAVETTSAVTLPTSELAATDVPASTNSGDNYQMILNNQTVNVVIANGYVDPYVYFVDYGYVDYGYSQERNAVCNTKSVHIYKTPDTNGPKREAEMLYQDDVLTVYGEIDGYYYVSTHAGDGTEFYGYVPKEYILYPVAAVDVGLNYTATEGYVKVKSCTLRSTPSQADDNNIVAYLYEGDTFTISDTANDYWYYINCNGYSGYVNHKMVTVY